jgi:hypothetical protein
LTQGGTLVGGGSSVGGVNTLVDKSGIAYVIKSLQPETVGLALCSRGVTLVADDQACMRVSRGCLVDIAVAQ